MARGEVHQAIRARRDQIDKRPLAGRRGGVDGLDHRLVLVRAGDRQHAGEARADGLGLVAHAAGDDDPAILGDGLADGGKALFLGRIEEAAGIDQHHIGPGIIGAHGIAIGAQTGEYAFTINQRLGAAEADHADLGTGGDGLGGDGLRHNCAAHSPICAPRHLWLEGRRHTGPNMGD